MGQINVEINGKSYRMACDDGQEEHLHGLARKFSKAIDDLRMTFGEIGDMRLTVMAGVMITDQVVEAERRLRALQAEVQSLREARDAVVQRFEETETNLTAALVDCADRIESVAHEITQSKGNGKIADH